MSREASRYRTGAALLGLAFLARPDAGLFWVAIPAVGALRWIFDGERPGRAAIEPAVLLGLFAVATTAWRFVLFGALVPNTAVTKGAIPVAIAVSRGLPFFQHWLAYQVFGVVACLQDGGVEAPLVPQAHDVRHDAFHHAALDA